jgi:tRNA pseudouridine38-40 synthase
MPRYRIIIEYDGTPFLGWQIQADGASVQGSLADAIQKLGGERVAVRGAGRTDAGVHATGQVAHFDLVKEWPAETVRDAVNFHLKPAPITILDCVEIGSGFDARFSAVGRHYLYRILARRAPPALEKNRVWWVPRPLDAAAMAAAAPALLGKHDFTTFRAAGCQANSPVKTLDRLDVTSVGEEIRIEASARSFLHHQVRSIVGSLKCVGEGKWPVSEMAAALEAKDRSRCGALAPSAGLYLTRVDYPSGPFPPRERS